MGRYIRRYVRHNVRKNVRRYVRQNVRMNARKNARESVRKNVRQNGRNKSEDMSEDMSERMSERMSENMSEDVRKNVRRFPAVSTSVCEAWKDHSKGSLNPSCPKALAFYCRRCKLEDLENCQWAGSCKAEWELVCECCGNHGTCRTGNWRRPRFHLQQSGWATVYVATLCPEWQAAESFGCGHESAWNAWTALTTTRTFMCSSRLITKTTCTVVFWNVMVGTTRSQVIEIFWSFPVFVPMYVLTVKLFLQPQLWKLQSHWLHLYIWQPQSFPLFLGFLNCVNIWLYLKSWGQTFSPLRT